MSDRSAQQPKPPKEEAEQPHDSAYVYSQIKGKHTEVVGSHLYQKEQKRNWGTTFLLAFLILGVVMAGWGLAYEVQYNIIQRPIVYTGHCPPPATLYSDGCFDVTVSVDQTGHTQTIRTPAGNITGGGP